MSVGADADERAASDAASLLALNLPQESAELGVEIARVQAEMERGIQLGGLKNDPTLPLVRTLATSLGLQWRLHNQAVTYFRGVSDRLDLQLTQTIRQGELALEARRSAIVQTLAPELARLTADSVRSWNRTVTAKAGVTLGAVAVALAFGVGLAGYGAGWEAGRNTTLNNAGTLAATVRQAGQAAENSLVDMVRANNVPDAWAKCQKSAIADKNGRRVCAMPMWAEPEIQPAKG